MQNQAQTNYIRHCDVWFDPACLLFLLPFFCLRKSDLQEFHLQLETAVEDAREHARRNAAAAEEAAAINLN